MPGYLEKVEREAAGPLAEGGAGLRELLRGDCHLHSDWSDGGSPIEEMGRTAARLGHAWAVLTDHSPGLTVANGLSPERLRGQLAVVAALNERWAPFRLLTGIECDILDDGSLDQETELLELLDVVVVSVHSKLRMEAGPMTRRMVAAVRNPHADVLGHCTGQADLGPRPSRVRVRRGSRLRGLRGDRHGRRDQQPSGTPRSAAPAAAPGGRGGCPVLPGHRRARSRTAGLADLRVRAGRGVRGAAGAGRHHMDAGGPARLDPDPRDTVTHVTADGPVPGNTHR